ncbi:diaminopimelate epimerase, partial [Streptomyces sp. SID8455]|nr:diaminopimelate epimerase [Streptomyces sp. SID8455]
MSTSQITFLKGHGTENDFVIVPDPDNALALPASVVAR